MNTRIRPAGRASVVAGVAAGLLSVGCAGGVAEADGGTGRRAAAPGGAAVAGCAVGLRGRSGGECDVRRPAGASGAGAPVIVCGNAAGLLGNPGSACHVVVHTGPGHGTAHGGGGQVLGAVTAPVPACGGAVPAGCQAGGWSGGGQVHGHWSGVRDITSNEAHSVDPGSGEGRSLPHTGGAPLGPLTGGAVAALLAGAGLLRLGRRPPPRGRGLPGDAGLTSGSGRTGGEGS